MFARIGSGLPLPNGGWDEPTLYSSHPLYASEAAWVTAQRRALGAVGSAADHRIPDSPDLTMRPARRPGNSGDDARRTGSTRGGTRLRAPRAATAGQALRRPPRLSAVSAAGQRPALPPAAAAAASGGASAAHVDPSQLWNWIAGATSAAELEGLISSFLGCPSFSSRHAALAARQLGAIAASRAAAPATGAGLLLQQDGSLMLVMERLAARLPAGLPAVHASAGNSSPESRLHHNHHQQQQQQQLLPSDVAGAIWGMAHVRGYACEHDLLQGLLSVAAKPYCNHPNSQHHQQQGLTGPELAMLASGLAAQGALLPTWLSSAALALLRAGDDSALGPRELESLLIAAAQAEHMQQQQHCDEAAAAVAATAAGQTSLSMAAAAAPRALRAAAAGACLRRLHDFSPQALVGVVLRLDALGMRAVCSDLLERAAQAIVAAASTRHQHQQQQKQQMRRMGSPGAAARVLPRTAVAGTGSTTAAASTYSALARHDPVLCVSLLQEHFKVAGAWSEHDTPTSTVAAAAAAFA